MTEEKQSAAEWLRGIVDESYGKESRPLCTGITETFFGIKCQEMHTCGSCILAMFAAIADRIDAERSLPEGVEWPRFEDGELVKVGDTVGSDEPFTAKEIAFEPERWLIKASSRSAYGYFHGAFGDPVKRPTPERPDSWERLEEDAYHLVMSEYLETPEEDVRNLVRRAKALAKAGE